MEYSPFFGMNVLIAEPFLPVFYVGFSILILSLALFLLIGLLLLLSVMKGDKYA